MLWQHSGVTHEQRESLVREVFRRITIEGKEFVSIEPQPAYVPLVATIVADQEFGYRGPKSTLSLQQLNYYRRELVDTGSVAWLMAA